MAFGRLVAGKISQINSLSAAQEKNARPVASLTNSLLEFHADLQTLGRWSPILAKHKLPPVDIVVSPRGEYLRTEGRLSLWHPLPSKLEPWQIPTNLVSDPLVSFTVARAIDPLLESLPGLGELGLKKIPSQVTAWGMGQGSFRAHWAFPTDQASNGLRRITPKIIGALTNYVEDPPGRLVYVTNDSSLVWYGLPFVQPTLKAATDGARDYLELSLLPAPQRKKLVPDELFAQIGARNDLLYYDWEITQDRLQASKWLYLVIDMVHVRVMTPTNAPSLRWLDQAAPRLGNTITEITRTSAKELKLVRKSHIGFTGFELASILRWIDSPAFPLGYEPPVSARSTKPPDRKKKSE